MIFYNRKLTHVTCKSLFLFLGVIEFYENTLHKLRVDIICSGLAQKLACGPIKVIGCAQLIQNIV